MRDNQKLKDHKKHFKTPDRMLKLSYELLCSSNVYC